MTSLRNKVWEDAFQNGDWVDHCEICGQKRRLEFGICYCCYKEYRRDR